jgi:hypothetical protein
MAIFLLKVSEIEMEMGVENIAFIRRENSFILFHPFPGFVPGWAPIRKAV